jgi:peroxiredoxin
MIRGSKTYRSHAAFSNRPHIGAKWVATGVTDALFIPIHAAICIRVYRQTKLISLMPLAVGSKAPDFTLKTKTADGLKDVKLSDNFGKKQTVLLFFPLAYTGTCTTEMCEVSNGLDGYSGLNAEVYGISVDSPHAHAAWAKANNITVTLLSDLNKTVTKAYDVLFPNLSGIGDTAARAAFVIGKDGVIKYAEQTPTPKDLPNFAAINAALGK